MASSETDELKPERHWEACTALKLYYKPAVFAKNVCDVLQKYVAIGLAGRMACLLSNGLDCSGIAGLREQVIHCYTQSL